MIIEKVHNILGRQFRDQYLEMKLRHFGMINIKKAALKSLKENSTLYSKEQKSEHQTFLQHEISDNSGICTFYDSQQRHLHI